MPVKMAQKNMEGLMTNKLNKNLHLLCFLTVACSGTKPLSGSEAGRDCIDTNPLAFDMQIV